MKFTAILPTDLAVGAKLPFDVFTRDGTLLLTRGSLVGSEATRLYLLENAQRVAQRRQQLSGSVFERTQKLAERLARIEEDHRPGVADAAWVARVRALARDLVELVDEDAHAAFAAMHLDIHHRYDVLHHIVAAQVCALLGLLARLNGGERISLVCAALTHDLGLLGDRARVEASECLSDSARRLIREHCSKGVALLRTVGVDDGLWLKVVAEHHERLDGSGYAGLCADQLDLPSRVMSLADSFSAMLRHRPYRERIEAGNALADLYADPQGKYDQGLVSHLVNELGLYPPGSVLRLASNETAVSIRPTPGEIRHPVIAAIADRHGRPMYRAVMRDSRNEENAIIGLLPLEKVGPVRKLLPACWNR
ncbi:HD-GYP domain-containing protein [Azonexus sp.]|uniref:HD-GYP domain-containing protein n=1 Tax=Azonexus sp. TaxID=1872668 RepID=UPI0035B13909